jgi:hypothetical protein
MLAAIFMGKIRLDIKFQSPQMPSLARGHFISRLP